MKVDMYNLRQYMDDAMGNKYHFFHVPLLGRFKGENETI